MTTKGVSNLYEYCCDGQFYDWMFPDDTGKPPPPVCQGTICMAPIFYKDAEILTLVEDKYDPLHEEQSTWRITGFKFGTKEKRLPHRPYKAFQLESDTDLMILKCKIRPVLVIKKIESDWRVPTNYFFKLWLCLPLFSYKSRHSQQYVLRDQKLEIPHRFYFPLGTPGLDEECAGLLSGLQCIPEDNMYPKKCHCTQREPKMDRPIRVTEKAFQAVLGHIAQFLPAVVVTGESLEWYDFFKELVIEQIAKATAS